MNKKDTSKIVGLLNYGVFCGISKKKILISYLCIVVLCLSLLSLTIVMISIEQSNSYDSVFSFVITIIISSFIYLLLPTVLAILITLNERMRKLVNLWLEDAIIVEAFAKNIGVKSQFGLFKSVKLRVEFDLEGIHYSKESQSKHYKNSKFEQGYYRIWSKYADKKVKILYSPKYDEVMVLELKQ